jgi:RAB6A-GEF complex partner protein 1
MPSTSLGQSFDVCADSSVSPRKHYILFSTHDPPAVQRIPWPDIGDESEPTQKRSDWVGYDTWVLNDHELPWLIDANGVLG